MYSNRRENTFGGSLRYACCLFFEGSQLLLLLFSVDACETSIVDLSMNLFRLKSGRDGDPLI